MANHGKSTAAEETSARLYVTDILSGLVPGDALFDLIYDVVAKHGGVEFERRKTSINIIAMAAEIRAIRTLAGCA